MSTAVHFSLEHYEHMVEIGAFAGPFEKRVELIRGEIYMMSPMGQEHALVLVRLTDWSYQSVNLTNIMIRGQLPLQISSLVSEPEPDLAWVNQKPYTRQHPGPEDALLILEVADSSLEYDRGEKQTLYAEAGVADYWIVNLMDKQIEVYRQPQGKTYAEKTIHRGEDAICPLALPEALLLPSRLF